MRNVYVQLIAPEALTDSKTGDAVDVQAFDGLADFVLVATPTGGAGQTAAVTVQHSDDGSTDWEDAGIEFEPVDDAEGSTQVLTTNIGQLKRYVRGVVTLDGDTPTVTASLILAGTRNYA